MNTKTVVGTIAVLALLVVGGLVYHLNRPTAEEASIANAITALGGEGGQDGSTGQPTAGTQDAAPAADATATEGPDTAEPAPAGSADAAAGTADAPTADAQGAISDASGSWVVDTEIGEFDFADATSSFVGFRVAEELQTIGQTEAVGRTPAVSGQLTIDGTTLTAADIQADLSAITSDVPRRDNAMRRAMGVQANPTGTFLLSDPVDFGEVPQEDEVITFTATGDLTVNGVTNPVELDMEAQVADGLILVVGRTPVVFADFGITAPQAGPVVAIEDHGTVELQLWFTRA